MLTSWVPSCTVPSLKRSQNGPRDGEQTGGCQGTGVELGWDKGAAAESTSVVKRLCILSTVVATEIHGPDKATWDLPAPCTHSGTHLKNGELCATHAWSGSQQCTVSASWLWTWTALLLRQCHGGKVGQGGLRLTKTIFTTSTYSIIIPEYQV